MDTTYILLGTAFIVVLFAIVAYNKIVSLKESVKQAWADVITQERQRKNVIDKLLEMVSSYEDYEGKIMEKVTEIRGLGSELKNQIDELSASNVDGGSLLKAQAFHQGMSVFESGFKFVAEAYPDLKNSEVYQQSMDSIETQEEYVGASIRLFNSNVNDFNTFIQMFPVNMVNALLNRESTVHIFADSTAEQHVEYKPNII